MNPIWGRTLLLLWFLKSLSYQHTLSIQKNTNETDSGKAKDIQKDYAVWSPSCLIPDFDPYNASIRTFIYKEIPIVCSELQDVKPLTSVVFNSISQRHLLRVNKLEVSKYSSNSSLLECCFSEITRNYHNGSQEETNDDRYDISKNTCFQEEVVLPAGTENIFVNCSSTNTSVYKTIHFLAADKKPKPKLDETKYSVFLFAIDSVSRMNFIRTLPKTKEYIERHGWLPLEGYTKVGENTFPNAISILTGMTVDQFDKLCRPYKKHKLDDCPFIWKNYSNNGYLTAYSEDVIRIGTFNYDNYGFVNSPTDYYSRPILKAAEDLVRNDSAPNGKNDFCLGHQPQMEYLFEFNTDFAQRFHDRPYFNLFWANSFSHDGLNTPTLMDDRVKRFLEDIEPYLNSTAFVLFADHGARLNGIRETFQGYIEDRMPFIYIHVPPSLKTVRPHWYRNLVENKNKLTSSFDLHATLQELLYGEVHQQPPGCPKCRSLFAPIPNDRSCDDAAIEPMWCPCWTSNDSNSLSNPPATAPAHDAILNMNKFIQSHEMEVKTGYRCAFLSLSKIIEVRRENATSSLNMKTTIFETKPGLTKFEITLEEGISTTLSNSKMKLIRRISNEDEGNACVVENPDLKQFCFCTIH